jgi:hypothetical protein
MVSASREECLYKGLLDANPKRENRPKPFNTQNALFSREKTIREFTSLSMPQIR